MNIYEKLLAVQYELKAPKSQYNNFGKYKYRNCEDILESLKPILAKTKATVAISDEIVNIGERFYVKATVKLIDVETGEQIESVAFAREEETKKSMDGSQVTGASSSYARKYALNGMFAIDDTKDADTLNDHGKSTQQKKKSLSAKTSSMLNMKITNYAELSNKAINEITEELTKQAGKSLKTITEDEGKALLKYLEMCIHKIQVRGGE